MFIMRGHVTVVSRYRSEWTGLEQESAAGPRKNGLNEFDTRILCGIFTSNILRSGATGQLKQLQFT